MDVTGRRQQRADHQGRLSARPPAVSWPEVARRRQPRAARPPIDASAGGGLTPIGALGTAQAAAVGGPSQLRLGYVDAVKGLIVAGVIVAHAAMTYGLVGNWPYQEVAHPLPQAAAYAVGFVTMLGMGMLFLVAGLFTPSAIQRKGTARFISSRSLRLGVPTVAYLLVIMPAVNFVGHWASGSSAAAAAADALDHLRRFDLGPMWFVFALLLVTAGYVGWRVVSRPGTVGVGGRDLLLLAALSAGGTFLVRIVQPVDDPAPLNVAGWPPDFLLFALGALAGRGWLVAVPSRTLRHAAALIAGGVLLLVPLAVLPMPSFSSLLGGWHWQSAVVSASESLVTIGLTVAILRQFQRIRRDPLPWITRGSFTAYLVQTPVILLLGIAMRPVALAPGFKVAILAVLGLAACFGLAAVHRRWTHGRRVGQRPHALA